MAKVRRKRRSVPSANLPSQMDQRPLIGANILGPQPVPRTMMMPSEPIPRPISRVDNMSGQIEEREMRTQGAPQAQPAPMPAKKAKVKRKKQASPTPSEPMSPQTWANIGNNPSDYPAYLAAWNKQFGKK